MPKRAQILLEELIRLRRDVHKHPELGFQEFRTAALVADTLREIGGIDVQTDVGRTGVVGQIGSGDGPIIAIRADMDALPITEESDVPYRSVNEGVMHACGHDAHTAVLLGVAHLLKQSYVEESWRGNVRFLFQPSEEQSDEQGISGAMAMIEDGALADVDAVIALHVFSSLEAGRCQFHDGFSLAAVDSFEAWVRGDGGHGAYPHKGSDPLYMLGPILTALYAIPSRRINPQHPAVVSLGRIEGGRTSNVIPSEVYLQGTIRSMDHGVRAQLGQEVEKALAISRSLGGDYTFELKRGYPAMHNDPVVNDWLRNVAREKAGADQVEEAMFGMGGEDFAYMTQEAPGAMFMLGAALADGVARNHHTPVFDVNESILPLGAAILAETARRFVTGQYGLGDHIPER